MEKVTIGYIADQLGLSRNTVSKVLNGKKVPAKTRELVLKKVKELNYKSLGENLETEKKKFNVLLLSGKPLANFNYFLPIISAIETSCYQEGHHLFQYVCKTSEEDVFLVNDYINKMNIDGIICIEAFDVDFIKSILSFKKPVVFLDFCCERPIEGDYDVVEVDNHLPIIEFVQRMVNKGKKTFAYIGDPKHCLSFSERYEAMLTGLFNLGIPHDVRDDMLLNDSSYSYHSPSEIATFLNLNRLCDVYICANDFIARNFINLLQEKKSPFEENNRHVFASIFRK